IAGRASVHALAQGIYDFHFEAFLGVSAVDGEVEHARGRGVGVYRYGAHQLGRGGQRRRYRSFNHEAIVRGRVYIGQRSTC
nr:hypothetical protein [Tanacetum cinerariifolium]